MTRPFTPYNCFWPSDLDLWITYTKFCYLVAFLRTSLSSDNSCFFNWHSCTGWGTYMYCNDVYTFYICLLSGAFKIILTWLFRSCFSHIPVCMHTVPSSKHVSTGKLSQLHSWVVNNTVQCHVAVLARVILLFKFVTLSDFLYLHVLATNVLHSIWHDLTMVTGAPRN